MMGRKHIRFVGHHQLGGWVGELAQNCLASNDYDIIDIGDRHCRANDVLQVRTGHGAVVRSGSKRA